jgi:hypothetical protein
VPDGFVSERVSAKGSVYGPGSGRRHLATRERGAANGGLTTLRTPAGLPGRGQAE